MKSAVFALASVLLAGAQAHATTTAVVPPEYANQEAPSNGVFFRKESQHAQLQFARSMFDSTPMLIGSVQFRYDSLVTDFYFPTSVWNFGDQFQIRIATAANTLANRSTAFASNLAADALTVLSGTHAIPVAVLGHAGERKGFGISFAFDQPFYYDPRKGDLVLDMQLPALDQFGTVDYVRDDPRIGFVFSSDFGPTGGLYFGGPVTQFTAVAVPEPTTWAMMILGFSTIGFAARRQWFVSRRTNAAR